MKRLALFVLLLVTSPLFAGYTYRNGYWYDDHGQAYTQNRYYQPGYNGCCGYYYYTYTPYTTPATYTEPTTYKTPGWRDKLLDGVLSERKAAQEQQYYMDAVNAFGIKGVNIQVPSQTTYGQTFFAPQASTVYGYTYHDLTKVYGDTDINQLYQAAARLAETQQRYAGEGSNNFAALVDQAGKDKAKFAEILARSNEIVAKGQAFALAMKSLEERKTIIESKGGVITTTPSVPPVVPAEGQVLSPGLLKLSALFGQDCSGCHNATKKNGGIDLADWRNFDSGTKLKIFNAVSNPDIGKRMPRVEGGGAGRQWSNEEAKLLLTN